MKRATPHSFVFLIACLLIIVGAGVPPAKAAAIDYYKFGRAYILTIDGVIEKGDYSKFIQKTSGKGVKSSDT